MALPIEKILSKLTQTIATHKNVVLTAQPGAGKTTRVPLALLEEKWLSGQKIIMLEPRRLAARSVARYMAANLREQVGRTIGYRVHRDHCVTPQTRIEVVTEGILIRMLQADPSLEGVGLIIFDEFHERSWQADLGLALSLECQDVLRDDLKMIVMSATLELEQVASLLGNAPVITCTGSNFPIETRYLHKTAEDKLNTITVKIREAVAKEEGDILVFLPGVGEIKRIAENLADQFNNTEIDIAFLYGDLSPRQQDKVLLPIPGRRKIILATSIAETSLTVEGVQIVIDSGLMRVSRFSPRTGMTRLETVTVSRFSADQRRGRAGRLRSGICYRLWTQKEDERLPMHNIPEILATDLSSLHLELAAWGVAEPEQLRWLDIPPVAAYRQAGILLRQLGALDGSGKITVHGRQMNQTGLHPRLAHMVLMAAAQGMGVEACAIAALLRERDILFCIGGLKDVDLRLRLEFVMNGVANNKQWDNDGMLDTTRLKFVRQEFEYLRNLFHIDASNNVQSNCCGILLAMAYPDRIGQAKGNGHFLLRNGRRVVLQAQQLLAQEAFIVVADVDDIGVESKVHLAAAVSEQDLRKFMAEQITEDRLVYWNQQVQAVRAIKYQRLGSLILKEENIMLEDQELILPALLQGIRQEGLHILPWNTSSRQLRDRLQFIHLLEPTWPDMSELKLLNTLETWLAPFLYGIHNVQQLNTLNLGEIFMSMLTWEQQQHLNAWAPAYLIIPSGRRIAIDYSDPKVPVLAAKLQEMFGAHDTPVIGGGRVPVTLHLLSPAGRPVQVTKDLASFWVQGYFSVRKDLRGRYPKHYWPEDPLTAVPTSRVRPQQE